MLKKELVTQFGDSTEQIRTFRAPGRVNIIGEHTDYNDGFVLPVAIDRYITVSVRRNNTDTVRICSIDFNSINKFSLFDEKKYDVTSWVNYPKGVVITLQKAGYKLAGFDAVFTGNIPLGGGLSSSAALEIVFVVALNSIFNLRLDKLKMIKLARRSENEFVGVNCGIMDQFISMMGKENHALLLDCRSLDYELVPFEIPGYKMVVINTNVKHTLVDGEYNLRRRQCEQGLAELKKYLPGITSLRDISWEQLQAHKEKLELTICKRLEHILSENARVQLVVEAMKSGQIHEIGKPLYESHYSLRDNYNVSCKELDLLVNIAENFDGVLGARITGGGFGGCTINIVCQNRLVTFIEEVKQQYSQEIGFDPTIYEFNVGHGTKEV